MSTPSEDVWQGIFLILGILLLLGIGTIIGGSRANREWRNRLVDDPAGLAVIRSAVLAERAEKALEQER